MFKLLGLFLLGTVMSCAQLKPVAISPPSTTGSTQLLPQNWVGAGSGYNPTGSPKVTGWVSIAKLISQGQEAYSYTTYDITFNKLNIPTTSARTGLATVVRHIGPSIYVLAFTTAGLSQSSTALQGTFSGGGMVVYKAKQGWTFEVGVRAASGSGAGRVVEAGFGRAW